MCKHESCACRSCLSISNSDDFVAQAFSIHKLVLPLLNLKNVVKRTYMLIDDGRKITGQTACVEESTMIFDQSQ